MRWRRGRDYERVWEDDDWHVVFTAGVKEESLITIASAAALHRSSVDEARCCARALYQTLYQIQTTNRRGGFLDEILSLDRGIHTERR